jgi:hypothetical protein
MKKSPPNVPIHLSLVLRTRHRNPASMAFVQEIAAGLGLEPATVGQASLSCRASPDTFARLFKTKLRPLPARKSGQSDFGTPAGYESEDLPIPAALEPYVETISVMPPATRLK